MKTELRPGAELDLLSQDELRTVLEETLAGYLRPPYRVRVEAAGVTDATGAAVFAAASSRPGYRLVLNSLLVIPAGYSYATPYTTTAGAVQLLRGSSGSTGDVLRGAPFGGGSGGSLPLLLLDDGDDRAVFAVDTESLLVEVIAGPAHTVVAARGHGVMLPV